MNKTQILAATTAALEHRLTDLEKGCFTHSRKDEARMIREELAKRKGG